MTTAKRPKPVAPASTPTARVHPLAAPDPNPSVNSDDPLVYKASPNEPSLRPIPWTNPGLHRMSAYPSKARDTHPTSRTKKKTGAAAASTRSRDWTVFRRTPIHLQGFQIGRNRMRLRRNRPRAARGMTRVRSTSSSVHSRMTTPVGSAIQCIEQAYRCDHRADSCVSFPRCAVACQLSEAASGRPDSPHPPQSSYISCRCCRRLAPEVSGLPRSCWGRGESPDGYAASLVVGREADRAQHRLERGPRAVVHHHGVALVRRQPCPHLRPRPSHPPA